MKTRFTLSLCALALATLAGGAQAANVLVTKAGDGWTVSRFTGTGADYASATYTADPTVQNMAVVEVNPINQLWTAQNDPRLSGPGAKWVSANVSSGGGSTDVNFTQYIYKGSFSVSGPNDLSLTFAADNFVDKLILSTNADGSGVLDTWTNPDATLGNATDSGSGKVWGFLLSAVQNKLSNGAGTVYITANTYNFDTALNVPNNPGPNGFIMAVNAVPVPVPAAVWGGLSLLGGLGLARKLRRA